MILFIHIWVPALWKWWTEVTNTNYSHIQAKIEVTQIIVTEIKWGTEVTWVVTEIMTKGEKQA